MQKGAIRSFDLLHKANVLACMLLFIQKPCPRSSHMKKATYNMLLILLLDFDFPKKPFSHLQNYT